MGKPKAKKTTDSAQTPCIENRPGLPPKPKGRPSAALKSRWLVVVAELMAKGHTTPTEIVKRTGLTFTTAKRWIAEIRLARSDAFTLPQLRATSEQLYHEANQVAAIAWRTALTAPNRNARVGSYHAILMANERRSILSGLE